MVQMIKRMVIMLLAVGILFGGIFGYKAFTRAMMMKYMFAGGVPPAVVSAVKAESLPWQPRIRAVGSIRAVRGVDVTTEVPGLVESVHFSSGDEVKAGALLVKLNTDADRAQMQALQAGTELSRIIYERDQKQLEVQAVSQAVVDADGAELKSRRAQLAQQKALVAKKLIRAPFAGQLGISTVTRGQYVNPGEKIVTLQLLDAVYVDFFLPQQDLSRIAVGQVVDVATDTYPGRMFTGKITAINPKVDADSRNVQVQVAVDNPKHELLPGMFASVEVMAGKTQDHVTVPQAAVTFNPYGETVYLVHEKEKDADGKPVLAVKQVFVTSGETRGDQVSLVQGVKAGDMVVTSGQMKLKNGSVVIINNEVPVSNDPAPKPVDQ
jgi:membrane fusion protein (multidrug efflux system)